MKTFSTLQTSIGGNVQDTSASFAVKIGRKINDRARDIWDRCRWIEKFNYDYTLTAIAGTDKYDLLGDFGEEISVHNVTSGRKLKRVTLGQLWEERGTDYSEGTVSNGTPELYTILGETDSGVAQIQLYPPPADTDTYAVPYMRRYTDLLGVLGTCTTDTADKIIASESTFLTSGVEPGMRIKNTTDRTYGYVVTVDSETQITVDRDLCPDGDEEFTIANEIIVAGINWLVELGATGDALMLKRRPPEAGVWFQQYEIEARRKIGQFKAQNNQMSQFIPSQRSVDATHDNYFGSSSNYPV